MLTGKSSIAVVGVGAIGGITAAFIVKGGHDLELVCKHRQLADKINERGLKVTGIKRHFTLRLIGFKYRRIKSSSLQSIEGGRPTEIEFLNGYICDNGKKRQVPTPANDAVGKIVHEIEAGTRNMSMDNLDGLMAKIGSASKWREADNGRDF